MFWLSKGLSQLEELCKFLHTQSNSFSERYEARKKKRLSTTSIISPLESRTITPIVGEKVNTYLAKYGDRPIGLTIKS